MPDDRDSVTVHVPMTFRKRAGRDIKREEMGSHSPAEMPGPH